MSKFKNFVQFLNGFRKWTIMAGIMLISSGFLALGNLSGAEFVDLHKVIIPVFLGANGVEHMMKAVKGWLGEKVSEKA